MAQKKPENDGEVQCTRRDFMRGDWFDSSSKTDQSTSNTRSETRSYAKLVRPTIAAVLATAVIIVVMTTAGAAAPTVDSTDGIVASADISQSAATVSCSEPVDAREEAHSRMDDLQRLDEEDKFVSVPDETMDAIDRQLKSGDSSFDLQQYCEARDAYNAALNLSSVALKDAYRTGAKHHINASEAMLEAERADGNPDPDVGTLQERVNHQQSTLATANDIDELRSQYTQAAELHTTTQSKLPTALHEKLVEMVAEQQVFAVLAAVLGLLKLLILGVFLRQRTTDTNSTISPSR